jgi:hypothetical protein
MVVVFPAAPTREIRLEKRRLRALDTKLKRTVAGSAPFQSNMLG